MDYLKMREEQLKSAIREDYFNKYKYTQIGNIDFVIAKNIVEKGQASLFEHEISDLKSILWAEAKQGTKSDIYESFVQLILTIGKEKTFEKYLPPKYIGAFDALNFAFIEYNNIQHVFFQNDFNWNVPPSNHDTKEFKQLYEMCKNILSENAILFNLLHNGKELREFITLNFKVISDISEKISVTKNNFTFVFQKWCKKVEPTINIDWKKVNKAGILSADFFLADLLSSDNQSIKDNLYVVLKKTKYELAKRIDELGFESVSSVGFKDKQRAYNEFWSIYSRPPKEEYWSYIIGRRDLLVPQDIRERKGSFFTPQIWVEKSQQLIAEVLGETWQDNYYIWDCCAGTGNLLNGLTNYDNVWASTLDKTDVDVMVDRINNGWKLAEDHVFQFDFLNDDFSKCPNKLQDILNDEEKRKRLVIYINPPYAEVSSVGTKGKAGVNKSNIHDKYKLVFGTAGRELYIQFLWRSYYELKNCIIAEFSKLKVLQGAAFETFRESFTPKLLKMFVVPAWTFDNVKGEFPIGFKIWNTQFSDAFNEVTSAVYNDFGEQLPDKVFCNVNKSNVINKWISRYKIDKDTNQDYKLGFLCGTNGNDFQQNGIVYILNHKEQMANPRGIWIHEDNMLPCSIYYAVRHCVAKNWLNDRDQFLVPEGDPFNDNLFVSDCFMYTLFNNNISSEEGVNHWIPYTREQVGCKRSFDSNFMSNYMFGKIVRSETKQDLFNVVNFLNWKITFSPASQDVYYAGLELWKYYHLQDNINPNASYYDIRKYFQGETNGRMNNDSNDENYKVLISDLRIKLSILSKQIEPKIYEYKFLK